MKTIGWLAGAATIFLSLAATAQVTAAPQADSPDVAKKREQVTVLLKRGIALSRAKRPEEARTVFAEALAILPTANVIRDLAIAEFESRHYVEALGHFREWLAKAESTETNERVAQAKDYIAKAAAVTGHLRVDGADQDAVVVDGGAVESMVHDGNVYDVLPGHHRIVASVAGEPQSRTVDVEAGATLTVRFEPHRGARATGPVPPAAFARGNGDMPMAPVWPKAHPSLWPPPVHAIVLGAVGVAAVGVGVGFALDVGSKNDSILRTPDYSCGTPNAPNCAALRDLTSSRDESQTLRNVFLYGGLAVVGTAAASWMLFPRRDAHEKRSGIQAVPAVGPGSAALHFTGNF